MSAYRDAGLGLLGDPMRRAIFETLARRPCSVGELAVAALRSWLDGVWEHALADFHKFAEQADADETAGTDHSPMEQP